MSYETLFAIVKKKVKPYNLALRINNTSAQNFSFTCSNHSVPGNFKYGFAENEITLLPTTGNISGGRTTYTIPVPANAQRLYIYFPEPAIKAGSFVQMTSNSYVTEVLFWDKFPQERISFSGWSSLTKVPGVIWDACRSFESMFNTCTVFNQILPYDTSRITSMLLTFFACASYNQPLNWNTVNVSTMASMLHNCSNFNQAVNFNSLNVTTMRTMFTGCVKLNQPIVLAVPKVSNIEYMFSGCSIFNQDLSTTIFKASTLKSYYDENCPVWITANKPKFTGA